MIHECHDFYILELIQHLKFVGDGKCVNRQNLRVECMGYIHGTAGNEEVERTTTGKS